MSCEALGLGVHLAAGATAVMGGIEELVAVDDARPGSGGDGGLRARHTAAATAAAVGEPAPPPPPEAEVEDAMPEPAGLREGFAQAAATFSRGLGNAAAVVASGPMRLYREAGG